MSLRGWVLFTAWGWIAGIALLIMISDVMESAGLGSSGIALGMSVGIALVQWFKLRRVASYASRWIGASTLGLTLPFLVFDLLGDRISMTGESKIIAATLIGACLLGLSQYQFVLRSAGIRLLPWAGINLLAYGLAIVPPFALSLNRINQLNLPGALSIVLSFLTVLAGGPIIGWLTGLVLIRGWRQD